MPGLAGRRRGPSDSLHVDVLCRLGSDVRDAADLEIPLGTLLSRLHRGRSCSGAAVPRRNGWPPSSGSAGISTGRAMQFNRDVKEFVALLDAHDVRFLIVGGYARCGARPSPLHR